MDTYKNFTKEYRGATQSTASYSDHQSLEGICVHEAVRPNFFTGGMIS